MKFFADTAEITEIRELADEGLLDGVTTNPSLIHKSGRDFLEVVKEIAGVVAGPVSAEVVALDHAGMMREAEVLRKIADNIAVKVPLTPDGLKACKALTSDGTMVNVTLCFSAAQALLAGKAGATFISPFVGRLDDIGQSGMDLIADICKIVDGPVSAEVVAMDFDTMMREAEKLLTLGDNVCIKVPLTLDGLKACKKLSDDGVMVNVTLCFTANQALLAAKAGAAFISPFVGRHDDVGFDGMQLIEDIKIIYDNYAFNTEILVASVRHPIHVLQAAKIGADVMTAPPAVIRALFNHPLTDKGLAAFAADWEKTGQTIL